MTAQIPNVLVLEDHTYAIVGVRGGELFDPTRLGLRPVGRSSACWRGYVCRYGLEDRRLVLQILRLTLREDVAHAPEIGGVRPTVPKTKLPIFSHVYSGMHLAVPFSGGMLVADEFVQELYVHMGFHPAWKYRIVFELILESGRVLEIRDVSEQMEELRRAMVERPLEPGHEANIRELRSWIESTFRLDYDLGLPLWDE